MSLGYVPTNIRFKCPECTTDVEIEVMVPEVDYSVDRLSDSLSEDDIDFECPHCDASFNGHVQNSPSHCAVEILGHPSVPVDADDALFPAPDRSSDDEQWLNLETAPQPYTVFLDAYHHLGEILAEYGEGGSGRLTNSVKVINRMVFASAIGAMEAYLGDLLANSVFSSKAALKKLLDGDDVLKDGKVRLSEILVTPDVVERRTREYLAGLLYHNLAKIAALYKIALDVDILPDKSHRERMMRTVAVRHDVVHRNGRDKAGQEVDVTTAMVQLMLEDVMKFVLHVDEAVRESLERNTLA